MERLVEKLLDAIMKDLDGVLRGYIDEFGGLGDNCEDFIQETRDDLRKVIMDVISKDPVMGSILKPP